MVQAGVLPAADEVLHAGVCRMAGLKERELAATGADGEQLLVAKSWPRHPSVSSSALNCAPAEGRSRRQLTRMSGGQLPSSSPPTEVRSSPVSSTLASSRSRGSPSRVGHVLPADSDTFAIAVRARAPRSNPTE